MKILLVKAPYQYPHKKALRTESLGQLYIAAVLRERGFEVSIYDPTMGQPLKTADGYYYGVPLEKLATIFQATRPDVIGLTCHNAYSLSGTELVARTAKSCLSKNIMTIAGGVYPSVYKGRILAECPSIDYAFQGESETALADFLGGRSLRPGELLSVDGLIFRSKNEIKVNDKRHFIHDLDQLPYPARDLVNIRAYMNMKSTLYGLGTKPTLSILTSRSCPNQCRFCNMWLIHGDTWRPRSPQNVIGEFELMVKKYSAKHIFVMDDNFTYDPERAKTICEEIIRRRLRFKWNTPHGISVRKMDFELARLMKKAGCINVCVGIESGSEWVRNELMGKGISNQQITHAVTCFKKAGLPVCGLMLLGYPGETEDHFKESMAFVSRLPLSLITASFVFPFPGTRLYDQLREEGIIAHDFNPPLDDYLEPVFLPPGLQRNRLKQRYQRLLMGFYLSHIGQIAKEMVLGRAKWITGKGIRRLLGS